MRVVQGWREGSDESSYRFQSLSLETPQDLATVNLKYVSAKFGYETSLQRLEIGPVNVLY